MLLEGLEDYFQGFADVILVSFDKPCDVTIIAPSFSEGILKLAQNVSIMKMDWIFYSA